LLTLARDLRRRKARERADLFLVEGVRAVEELLASPLSVRGALVGPQLAGTPRGAALHAALEARGIEVATVGARELTGAADTDTPQGIVAIADVPERGWDDVHPTAGSLRILLLDGVQDPGNVGTTVRTALAFGIHATVAMPGTVDLWNAKVVRSAMGALFDYPAFADTWEAFDAASARHGLTVWGADVEGEPIDRCVIPARVALIVGNEGSGLSAPARARAERIVSLPIARVESLNVAVAAGVLLYALQRAAPRTTDT
jgi:TrmH family RNA methyltransferase